MKVDVGKLTQEESVDLLKQIINVLPEADVFQALEEALTTEQKEELGEGWFNIDR
jgi:hypothetical protein